MSRSLAIKAILVSTLLLGALFYVRPAVTQQHEGQIVSRNLRCQSRDRAEIINPTREAGKSFLPGSSTRIISRQASVKPNVPDFAETVQTPESATYSQGGARSGLGAIHHSRHSSLVPAGHSQDSDLSSRGPDTGVANHPVNDPIRLPVAFAIPEDISIPGSIEDELIRQAQESFAREMAADGSSSDPTPAYAERWKELAESHDDYLRRTLGWERFNVLSALAAQTSYQPFSAQASMMSPLRIDFFAIAVADQMGRLDGL